RHLGVPALLERLGEPGRAGGGRARWPHRRDHPADVLADGAAVVTQLGDEEERVVWSSHGGRVPQRARRVLRPGGVGGPDDLRALRLVGDHEDLGALRAGLLRRWRKELGGELDHRPDAGRVRDASGPATTRSVRGSGGFDARTKQDALPRLEGRRPTAYRSCCPNDAGLVRALAGCRRSTSGCSEAGRTPTLHGGPSGRGSARPPERTEAIATTS